MRSNQRDLQKRRNPSFCEEGERTKNLSDAIEMSKTANRALTFWKHLSAITVNILTVDQEKRKPYCFSERGTLRVEMLKLFRVLSSLSNFTKER